MVLALFLVQKANMSIFWAMTSSSGSSTFDVWGLQCGVVCFCVWKITFGTVSGRGYALGKLHATSRSVCVVPIGGTMCWLSSAHLHHEKFSVPV